MTTSIQNEPKMVKQIRLFAQPYDVGACGFYFSTSDEFCSKSKKLRNAWGYPVEEFEIVFIDSAPLDCALADAIGLNQVNFVTFLDCVETWDEEQKIKAIIAVGELGYDFDTAADPDSYDIFMHIDTNFLELAVQFVDEGYYGDVPLSLQSYIDYDAIARDLSIHYGQVTIAEKSIIYETA